MTHFPTLSIAGIEVRQDAQGRFSLNDLHRAAGGEKRHQPSDWLRLSQTQKLVAELASLGGAEREQLVHAAHGGFGERGTYVVKELFTAYALWAGGPRMLLKLAESLSDTRKILSAIASFEVPDDLPDMFVYAIQETDTGNVKLGISRDPLARLKQLQIGNSHLLRLVAYRPATNRFADERALHADAETYRLLGEWFSARAADYLQNPLSHDAIANRQTRTHDLEHKVTVVTREDGSEKTVEQVRVTPKGLARLASAFNVSVVEEVSA